MNDKDQDSFDIWEYIKNAHGYSDKELEIFKKDPRNLQILEKSVIMPNINIAFEVVKSHGCAVGHKVGEKFLFSSAGYLLTNQCPEKICAYLMPAMSRMVWIIQERIYEGLDPQPTFFCGHCDDVGYDCGGWGKVNIEASIIDTRKS
jgi:uncharacterized repeat protein (TIGR04076 family)